MRRAILSDIHGNLEALQSVLADIKQQECDQIVCLGDIIGYGPDPQACLDIVAGFDACILGNHDLAALFDPEGFSNAAEQAILWTRQQMESGDTPENCFRRLEFLAAMLGPLDFREFAFWTFEILWASLTVAIFGGVLARRAMIELGQRTVAPWFHSVKLVVTRWQSYLWASGMNMVGIAALLILPMLFGLVSRFGSGGAYVGGVLLILFFPLAFGVGRFVLSLTICFPLSVCAIGAEKKADAFEGFSRSNAYFFQRPVVAFAFAAALFACGYVGDFLVSGVLNSGWSLVRNSYLYSGGMSQSATEPFVAAGNWLAQSLIAAFWFSYFWSASGALYLILRRSVDHTELSEIDLAEQAAAQELPEIPPAPKVEETKADAAKAEEASAE